MSNHIKLKSLLIPEELHVQPQGPTPSGYGSKASDETPIGDTVEEVMGKKREKLKRLQNMKETLASGRYANGPKKQ